MKKETAVTRVSKTDVRVGVSVRFKALILGLVTAATLTSWVATTLSKCILLYEKKPRSLTVGFQRSSCTYVKGEFETSNEISFYTPVSACLQRMVTPLDTLSSRARGRH